MNNLKSYTEYAVSTPTTDFVIGFDFNYGTDAVNVTVDGVPATEAGYSVIYLNSTTMRLSPAVPTGVVRLQRETDIDVPDNQFTAGAKFIASNMDENFTQLRHSQQEVRDGFEKLSDDTYEIIDTLQDVGQAAQDAADAAEQAAQTANAAAAQVNDKVSYQDLDDAVDTAVAPVKDYTALPFEVGKSYDLNARVMLDNGDIVRSTVVGNTVDPNVDMTGWVNAAELQRVHNKSSATFTDYLTANEIANSATTNLASKLQAINDSGEVSKLRIPKGDWLINSAVTFTRDFEFDMDPDAYFKFGLNGSITFTGSATLIGKPTANISNGSRTIQLANSLQNGDLICIYNPNDFSFSPLKAEYRNGEFLKVATASASSITTYGRPYENYVATSVDIYKINSIKIGFNRFNVKAENTAVNDPVSFVFCEGMSLTGYSNVGSKSKGFILDRCYNVTLFDFRAKNNSALVGLNYGIIVQNCQNIRVYGGDNNGARHSITTGGGGDVCAVPCREIFIENATLKTSNTAGISAADFHANISDSRFRGCILDHATIGGKNISIEDSTVFSRDIDGTAIIVGGIIGGYFNFTNCTLVLNADISSSRGAIDILFEHDLVEDVVFNFNDIKLTGSSETNYATLKFLAASGVSISKKVTINIPYYDSQLTNQGAVLRVNGSDVQNIIPDLEINMGHITTKKKGIYYVQATNTITAPSTKLSLPVQKGSTTITAASNTTGFILGNTVTLDYFYPTVPSVVHSVGTDGTWNTDGTTYGMKPVTSMLHTNSATAVRFALIGSAAIPNNTYKISYTAGL